MAAPQLWEEEPGTSEENGDSEATGAGSASASNGAGSAANGAGGTASVGDRPEIATPDPRGPPPTVREHSFRDESSPMIGKWQ